MVFANIMIGVFHTVVAICYTAPPAQERVRLVSRWLVSSSYEFTSSA